MPFLPPFKREGFQLLTFVFKEREIDRGALMPGFVLCNIY